MSKDALKRAVRIAGGQTSLAGKIGTGQSQVWYWLARAKKSVPPGEYVLPIEAATEGRVTRSDLRPDLYPQDLYRHDLSPHDFSPDDFSPDDFSPDDLAGGVR